GLALLFGAACSLLSGRFSGRFRKEKTMGAPGIIRIGTAVAAVFTMTFAGTPAGAQQAIKFSLDFKFEGPSAPFVVGLDKGYYKAEGLDVTIDSAAGSLEPINRVASGSYDM